MSPRVTFLVPGDRTKITGPCHHYRLHSPAKVLKGAGWDVRSVYMDHPIGQRELNYYLSSSDLIVTHRVAFASGKEAKAFCTAARAAGTAFIVDLDDRPDMSLHDSGAFATLRGATMVTCSTQGIADVASAFSPRVRVIPNAMDVSFWHTPTGWTRLVDGLTVGVQGGPSHHEDWRILPDIFRRVASNHPDVTFIVAGFPPTYFKPNKGYKLITIPWVPFEDSPGILAQIDIHLAPLRDTLFNRAKSWIKWAEAALIGKPCVCSPIVYGGVAWHSYSAFIAEDEDQFVSDIERLIADPTERQRLVSNARHDIRSSYGLDANGQRWVQAYTEAIEITKGVPV